MLFRSITVLCHFLYVASCLIVNDSKNDIKKFVYYILPHIFLWQYYFLSVMDIIRIGNLVQLTDFLHMGSVSVDSLADHIQRVPALDLVISAHIS